MKHLAYFLLCSALMLAACKPEEVYPEPPQTREEHIIGHWIAYAFQMDSTNGGLLVEFPPEDSVVHYVFSAQTYRMYNARSIDKTDDYHLTGGGIAMGSELPVYISLLSQNDMRWETDIPTRNLYRTIWVKRIP